MPVEHAHTIKAGSTSQILLLYAHDGQSRAVTGLRADTPRARAGFIRAGEPEAHAITLAECRPGEYKSGGFVELNADLVPGLYQLGLPDKVLAEGSEQVVVVLFFPGALIDPAIIHLVGFDPQDSKRLGMAGLADKNRHEFLRRALPRLTEKEFELGRRQEQALNEQRRE